MSYDEINQRLKNDKGPEQPTPKVDTPVTKPARRVVPPTSPVMMGRSIAAIGTERVVIETGDLLMIEYTRAGKRKMGYAIIEKGVTAKDPTTYVNKDGFVATALRRDVFVKLVQVMDNALRRLNAMQKELLQSKQERDTAMMLVDTLKKNGVIE